MVAEAVWRLPEDPALPAALEAAVLPPLLDGRCVTVPQFRARVRRAAWPWTRSARRSATGGPWWSGTVGYVPGEDGMASMPVLLGAPEAQLIFTRLTAAATLLPADGSADDGSETRRPAG